MELTAPRPKRNELPGFGLFVTRFTWRAVTTGDARSDIPRSKVAGQGAFISFRSTSFSSLARLVASTSAVSEDRLEGSSDKGVDSTGTSTSLVAAVGIAGSASVRYPVESFEASALIRTCKRALDEMQESTK